MDTEPTANDRLLHKETGVIESREIEPQNIIVPLDGSRRAARAILPARRLGAALGLPVGVITVHGDRVRVDRHELESIRAGNSLQWSDSIPSPSAAEGIIACAREREAIIVMATGGRNRSVAIVGSTASSVVSHARQPLVLVGPGSDVDERRPITELVVAVSGTPSGESICQPAVSLAQSHRFDLHFVVVVQPTLEPSDPRTPSDRRFGPVGDENAYIADLVRRHDVPGLSVKGSVVYDPLSPAGGLSHMLRGRPQSMLVLGTKNRTGMARLRHGSVASRIVRESPVPAIMIPPIPDALTQQS